MLVVYGWHTNCMIKTKINQFEYWDLQDIKICFVSPINGSHDFYAKTETIVEEAIVEYENGNLITLDMIFLNVN